MGISVEHGRGGRRKPLDADLNLVPYIDLLTCMVAFLLATAVWTQLARLEVRQHGQGESGTETLPESTKIAVVVRDDGFNLVVNADQKPLALDYGRLAAELKALRPAFPDKKDIQVVSEDGVDFDKLVRTMDVVLTAGFPDVSLLDAAPGS